MKGGGREGNELKKQELKAREKTRREEKCSITRKWIEKWRVERNNENEWRENENKGMK